MRIEKGGNGEGGILPLAVVIMLMLTLAGLVISASISSTSASGPSLPLLLYGKVSYKDGSPAPNIGVSAKNEVSGLSLNTTTDEKGVWSMEVSEIAKCGDVVLIVARDAWNNEISEKVNVSEAPQRMDLQFDVSPPTTTPPFIGDGDNNEEGEIPSGTQNETEQGTEIVTPTHTPTATPPSPGISNANVSENRSNVSQSDLEPEGNASSSIFSQRRSKSPMAVVSAIIALVAGLVLVTLLVYFYRRSQKQKRI